jgi:hypothetical protein
MSYGLQFINNAGLVTLDSEYARMNVICTGRYAPTEENGLGSGTLFPVVITSQEPPMVFCRPDTFGIGAFQFFRLIGSPGAWTGFYVRTYSTQTAKPNGRYFAATFGAQPLASFGMRLWDASSRLLFDTGTPTALFTRAFQNWNYDHYELSPTGSAANFFVVPFNFPENEYLLANSFGMKMLNGVVGGRDIRTLWDFANGKLYAVAEGFSNPNTLFLPALFAKLAV